MVALVRSWQDLAKILASIPMHLGKRAKIRVTGFYLESQFLDSRKPRKAGQAFLAEDGKRLQRESSTSALLIFDPYFKFYVRLFT